MLGDRREKQIECNLIYWATVCTRLQEAGIIEPVYKVNPEAMETMTECAALGIFPEVTERSCREFLAAIEVTSDIRQAIWLFMNADEAIDAVKGLI